MRAVSTGIVATGLFLAAGCALAGAALLALGNLTADLLRALVDPRVRTSAGER